VLVLSIKHGILVPISVKVERSGGREGVMKKINKFPVIIFSSGSGSEVRSRANTQGTTN
jgi:predicted dienelactone hydrolase